LPGVDQIADNGLGGKYAQARSIYNGAQSARRAIQTGNDIWAGKAGVDAYHALDDDAASQKLVRLGLTGGYDADTKNMPRGHDVTKLFDKQRLQEVLSEIIPRTKGSGEFSDRPERFGRYLANEQMMSGTAKRTYQGSPTAERIADDKAANELFALTEQLKQGGLSRVLYNKGADIINKMFGYRADTMATLGRILFTADPVQRGQAITTLRQYMGPDRFTMFQQLMKQQAQRALKAGAAVTPGAVSGQPPQP
jgi:hypothetical protein